MQSQHHVDNSAEFCWQVEMSAFLLPQLHCNTNGDSRVLVLLWHLLRSQTSCLHLYWNIHRLISLNKSPLNCLQYCRASVAHSSNLFHVPPENQFQRVMSHMVWFQWSDPTSQDCKPLEPREWPGPSPRTSNCQVPLTEHSNCPNCRTLPPPYKVKSQSLGVKFHQTPPWKGPPSTSFPRNSI